MKDNMHKKIIPDEIASSLENDFKWKDAILFCQMSTSVNNVPHVRTVRLYGIEEDGFIFLTRNTSRKWHDLKQNPRLAICILHPEYRIQIQAECIAQTADRDKYRKLYEKYWDIVRSDVKKIYHDDYMPNVDYQQHKETSVPAAVPHSFGMIMAMPYFWEYLSINDNYSDSIRYLFIKDGNEKWSKSRLTMS